MPSLEHVTARLQKLAGVTKDLVHITAPTAEAEPVRIENMIGFIKVPLGLAGPLTIHGAHQKGTMFAPFATTESALVASASRGCKAFQLSGGIHVEALSEGMSRAPRFRFSSIAQAIAFHKQVPSLESQFRCIAESTSRYAKLTNITSTIIGTSVHVKFTFNTGSAAGQNMVTFATHAACQHFLQSPAGAQAGVVGFSIEGQMASDKKASWGNVFTPRGVEVIAWGTLSEKVCRTVLGVSTLQLYQTITMGQDASIRNGQFGSNCNTANVVAAMFIACGQDAASVLEAGWAQATAEYNHQTQELLISMYIPSLLVGTVGGGTGYSTQQEALKMLGCEGQDKKWAFAETVAAFCLALDVSTASAISNDTFATAHKVLARV